MQYMTMTDDDRSALLRSLAATPETLRREFEPLDSDALLAPGPDGAFAPIEHVWHMADLEAEGFGIRIRRLLTEDHPTLPDFDGGAIAAQRNYKARSLHEGLEKFKAARLANLRQLAAIPADAWNNSGTQEAVGPVSLCDMPAFLQQHDQAHLAEIALWRDQRHADPDKARGPQ